MMPGEQLGDLIARYLEDALTPSERAELLAELNSSETSARAFREALDFNALLHAAARKDAAFAENVLARVSEKGVSNDDANARKFSGDTIARLKKSSPKGLAVFAPQRRFASWIKWGASAAALLAVGFVAYFFYFKPVSNSGNTAFARATLKAFNGGITITRKSVAVPAQIGTVIDIGDTLSTASNATAEATYTDGSTIALGADSTLTLVERTGAQQNKHLRLDAGTLTVIAAHQPAGQPMVVTTPHAVATVVGTRFVLNVDKTATLIDVAEGRVRFETLASGSIVEVAAGMRASTEIKSATPPVGIAPPSLASRSLALWPFSARSPWNMPVGGNARYEPVSSAAFDPSKGVRVSCREFSHPVFIAKAGDPVRKVVVLQNTEPFASIRVPETFQPDPHHIIHCLIDPQAERFYELRDWKRLPNGDINVHEIYANDLRGDGFPGTDGSSRISGAAGIGGLIRVGELKNGIRHALALSAPKAALGYSAGGRSFVWPANTGNLKLPDAPSNLHFGTLLAIPPGVDVAKLGFGSSGPAFEIAKALQDYGGYIVESFNDDKNALGIFIDPAAENELPPELEAQLVKLVAAIQTISNNTPDTLGGGGVLRRPLAPTTQNGAGDDF